MLIDGVLMVEVPDNEMLDALPLGNHGDEEAGRGHRAKGGDAMGLGEEVLPESGLGRVGIVMSGPFEDVVDEALPGCAGQGDAMFGDKADQPQGQVRIALQLLRIAEENEIAGDGELGVGETRAPVPEVG